MRVCLYLAIPAHRQNRMIKEDWFLHLKRQVKKAVDFVRWWLLQLNTIDYHAWHDVADTNKGDAAIRQATRNLITATFADKAITFSEIAWGELDTALAKETRFHCDLFVIAGSGYFHLDRNGDIAPRVSNDEASFTRITCPKIAFGIGLNQSVISGPKAGQALPSISDSARLVVRNVLGQLSAVSVRDAQTKAVLSSLTDANIYLGGDAALFLVSPLEVSDRQPRLPLQIGLNIGVHEAELVRRLPRTIPAYVELLKRMQREHGAEIHYVQHTRVERVIPLLLRARGLRVVIHDVNFGALPELYAGFDIHVCEMLHSSILSLAAGTPAINIAYDNKNLAFYELMGLKSLTLSAEGLSGDLLVKAVIRVVENRPVHSQRVLSRIMELRKVNEAFLQEVYHIAAEPAVVLP